MKTLETSIIIKSSPARIWDRLTDFESYPEWNPFIIHIKGRPRLRERLKVTIQPPDSKTMVFRPQVTLFHKQKTFAWLGSLLIRGLFDGHHIFEIHDQGDGSCMFIHKEEFSGLLVPLFWSKININTRAGFIEMNEKLKKRCEG